MNLGRTAQNLLAGLVFVTAALPALAGVIDQQIVTDGSTLCFAVNRGCSYQQVVTPGMSGLLTGLEVNGSGNADLRFAFGGGPAAGGWAAQLLHVDLGHLIDVSSYGIYLTTGSSFVFELSNPDSRNPLYGAYLQAGFPNKLWADYADGFGFSDDEGYSLAYSTTVEAATARVPEPQSAALVLTALVLLGAASRRAARR